MLTGKKDQYLGINCIQVAGTALVLFIWATISGKRHNVQAITVCDAYAAEVTSKGHALCNNIGAHNLCWLPRPDVYYGSCPDVRYLAQMFGEHIAFAVGGEYRDPLDKRNKKQPKYEFFKGIFFYGLQNVSSQARQNLGRQSMV